MSILDLFLSNPALTAIGAILVVLVALAAWKLIKDFFPF